jgi:hypothetical protein
MKFDLKAELRRKNSLRVDTGCGEGNIRVLGDVPLCVGLDAERIWDENVGRRFAANDLGFGWDGIAGCAG